MFSWLCTSAWCTKLRVTVMSVQNISSDLLVELPEERQQLLSGGGWGGGWGRGWGGGWGKGWGGGWGRGWGGGWGRPWGWGGGWGRGWY